LALSLKNIEYERKMKGKDEKKKYQVLAHGLGARNLIISAIRTIMISTITPESSAMYKPLLANPLTHGRAVDFVGVLVVLRTVVVGTVCAV